LNRLTNLVLIAAGSVVALIAGASFVLAEPREVTEAHAPVQAVVDAKAANARLKSEVDTFVRTWRSGLDGLNHKTSSGELTGRTNTLWAKHVHFEGSACLNKDDGLKIREYLKDAAARQSILTEAPNASTVAMFQTDSATVDCKNYQMTGHIIIRNVRFTTVTVH